jgi:hypothetical protein
MHNGASNAVGTAFYDQQDATDVIIARQVGATWDADNWKNWLEALKWRSENQRPALFPC